MSEPFFTAHIFTILILLFLSAFFSGSEAAFLSLSSYHFHKLIKQSKKARILNFWFKNPNKVLITVLVGNNIVNIASTVLITILSYNFFHKMGVAIITGIMTFLILIFGEIIPKSLAKKFAEQVALSVSLPMQFFCFVLTPISKIFIYISNLIVKIFGVKIESILPVLTEEDLKAMIFAGKEEGAIEEETEKMLSSIFQLGDIMVKEIMVPRVKIIAIREDVSIREVLKVVVKEGYSRLPVFKGNLDKIVGIVYIKDIIATIVKNPDDIDIITAKDVMRQPYFIHERKKVQELMKELQREKLQMAIVVDEYGGTAGLVTMEDLVEEIVGEISDEYKKEIPPFQKLPDGSYLVQGNMEIEKANKEFNLKIVEKKTETLAGFILDYLGRCPKQGEKFYYNGYQFFIQEANNKTVLLVRIKKL